MDQTNLLNILVILESVLLLVISIILFSKTRNLIKLKKYEEAFIESQAKQKALQNDFFPMLVHELRSPLSVIKGGADLLIKDADSLSADQIRTLLDQIKSSSTTLLEMVGSILDVSKMESGKFQINKAFINVNEVLKEECAYFQSLTKVKDITLECFTDDNIPNFSFDPERIKQVFGNIISNAIKFSSKGGKITVSSKKNRDVARIEFIDTGVGISDDDKPRLFQKFFQASNQNGHEKGTGLGLVISKGIVEAHAGSISVEDNKPQGSKFIINLPIK